MALEEHFLFHLICFILRSLWSKVEQCGKFTSNMKEEVNLTLAMKLQHV